MSRAFLPTIAPRSWLLAVTLAGAVWLTPSAAQGIEPVTLTVGADFVDIQTRIAHERSVLRIAGPDGYALTLHVPAETALIEADLLWDAEPRMTQQDAGLEAWSSLPVGTYHYEVVLYAAGKVVGRTHGMFDVEADGRAIEKLPPLGEPLSSATPTGGLRHALDAVLGFLMPTAHAQPTTQDIRISKLSPSLILDSTATADGDNWLILGDTLQWSFRDLINDNTVFSISPGAGNDAALSILGGGNVGVGTSAPQRKLHVSGGDVRISPLVGADWDINPGNVGLFFNRVGGSPGVLRLDSDAPGNSIVASQSGVGIGTNMPTSNLHVQGSTATQLRVRNAATAGGDQVMFSLEAQGDDKIRFELRGSGGSNNWTFDNTPVLNQFSISKVGTGVNEFTVNANGNGVFRGTVTATNFLISSSREIKTDIEALDERVVLEGVMALPVAKWRYRSDTEGTVRIGPMAEDFQAAFAWGDGRHVSLSDMGGITLAAVQGLYRELQQRDEDIARLQSEMTRLQQDNAVLRAGLARDNRALTERLAALEELLLGRQEIVQR